MTEAVLLLGHGSGDADGAAEFRGFAEYFGTLYPGRPVAPAFLELAEPSIGAGIARCVEAGAERIVALPLFLFAARHVKLDVAGELDRARRAYPMVDLRYGTPLGVAPELVDLALLRLREAEAELPPVPPEESAIVLAEAGSSDPDANANVYKVARLVWEGLRCAAVEPGFISVTRPTVAETITRTASLGVRRIVVLPYFLFTGVLCKRVERVARRTAGRLRAGERPNVEVVVARHLGRHRRLADVVARRLDELIEGEPRMTCDLCKYRVRFAGFDHAH